MRRRRNISPDAAAVEFVPANCFAPLNLREVFGRSAPTEVDLGCGDGSYITAVAEENPARNFLAVERLAGRVRASCGTIARRQLGNARVIRIDSLYAVANLLEPASITAFHLMFPDPWPKRRHQNRRIVTDEFLASVARALEPGGTFQIATDHRDYFDQITILARRAKDFHMGVADDDLVTPQSTFERRFRLAGTSIYRLLLRKISDVR